MTGQDEEQRAARAIEAGAYGEAVQLLQPLAERNSQYALLTLGWIHETGAAGSVNKDVARQHYERATAAGSVPAYRYLGWLHLGQGEESLAWTAFQRGAQLNDDECKIALAQLADNEPAQRAAQAIEAGAYGEAVQLLQPLAEHNSQYALLTLGWIHETGAAGSVNKDVARQHYERATAAGSAAAYFELGRLLLSCEEEAPARAAFEAGAALGDIPCMSKLGRMMVEGRGGLTDIEVGCAWLEKAAAQGHILAQRMLLEIKKTNAKSLIDKALINLKIGFLAKEGAGEILKNHKSDKIR